MVVSRSNGNTHYVILRADQFERVRMLFEPQGSDIDPREVYPLVDVVMVGDDNADPLLETYQQFQHSRS